MDKREKQLSSQYYFEGRIMKARLDQAVLPDGTQVQREVCEHIGGVGVLPIDQRGNVLLVQQFRYPFDKETLEIPAGKLDHGPGEDIASCGMRELHEETGCTAGRLVSLGCIYPSPGFLTEVTHLYAALDLTEGQAIPDEGELVELVRLPLHEVERMVAEDRLRDAKTIAALYRARLLGLLQE